MRKLRLDIRKAFLLFITLFSVCFISSYFYIAISIPGNISLIQGEEYQYNFRTPLSVSVSADRTGMIKLNGNILETTLQNLPLSAPVSISSLKDGQTSITLKLLGVIPIRTMVIDVYPNISLIPCGNTVGVKIHTDGVLIIGISNVEGTDGKVYEPAKKQGIKPGDIIYEINNKPLMDTEQLIKEIDNSKGNEIALKCKRNGSFYWTKISPMMSKEDGKYHIGLWVRDGTAGIGTLTFYDPATNMFGALGHGITDIDTGSLLTVKDGEILHSSILSVRKGLKGKPGELKGVFVEDENKIGSIMENTDFGIYGEINNNSFEIFKNQTMPIGLRTQVKEGPAQIMSNIDGNKIETFNVEIQKVSSQYLKSSKGMMIKITDERLLNATGGIVQGMSGSPIIQDGKLIGAVTHVLINRPECGYGIFIEWMIQQMNKIREKH